MPLTPQTTDGVPFFHRAKKKWFTKLSIAMMEKTHKKTRAIRVL